MIILFNFILFSFILLYSIYSVTSGISSREVEYQISNPKDVSLIPTMVTMALALLFFHWQYLRKFPENPRKPPETSGKPLENSEYGRKLREMQMYLPGPETGNISRSMDSLVLRHPIICTKINVRCFNSVCICPLSWSVPHNSEMGWACTPHTHQPGVIFLS